MAWTREQNLALIKSFREESCDNDEDRADVAKELAEMESWTDERIQATADDIAPPVEE